MTRIYQTPLLGEAHVRIALVNRGQADLLVHRVGSWGLAHGPGRWYITRNKQDATVWACFTSQGMADLCICFVDNYGEAGWQRPHRLKALFR